MGISFTTPEALLFLVPAVGLTLLLSAAARHRLSRGRRRLAVALRVLLIALLVGALAGLQLVLPVDRLTTVFVVDLSDSVGAAGRQDALAFVREALEKKPDGDRAGIVAFGADALVERLPTELREFDAISSVPTRSATDVGGALRLAAALFPDESQKRIVLLSDGNDTTGRGQTEAALAAARGIQVETRVIGDEASQEIILERLHTPATARVGEEIEAEVTVRATVAQSATLRLFGDGRLLDEQQVELQPGSNRFVFRVAADEAGFHTFRAVVEAPSDTFGQNNRADSDTIVKGDPRVLVVGDEEETHHLVAALGSRRHKVDSTTADGMPRALTDLAAYDSIVLVDVPANELGQARIGALNLFTRDLGRGFVMLGGERSYAAGGYKGTAVEDALPVEVDVRDRQKEPDVALVVVIDKSGSMDACHCNTAARDGGIAMQGVPKVDIGKEAILRAVAALTNRDEFGVVAFNENAHWVIRTAPLGEVGDVEGQIAGIRPDGQTNIFAGLSQAVESLEEATASRRHIVLLTDGWSSSGDYEALLTRMKAADITLSAVGAGAGSADLLRTLAERGGGRYYPAANPETIPDIFLKETQQVSGQHIVEEPFFPIQTGSSPILRGLEQGLPRLLGYNGTTPKAAAQTVLVTARDDPLLAQWQYGLGRSVAWTSDASGRWAKHWVAWPGFNRFFSQLVAWTLPGEETGGIEAAFVAEGDRARLRVNSLDSDGSPRNFYDTRVTLVSPDLASRDIRLQQTAPGTYEAPLETLAPGAYALRVTQTKPGAPALGRTLGLVAPTPAEYRLLGTNQRLLGALRASTAGRELAGPEETWRHDLQATRQATDLWPLLLLLALLLWPLDVAVRRVSLTRGDVVAARAWIAERWARRRSAARRADEVGGMLAAKERAAGTRSRAALLTGDADRAEPSAPRSPGARVASDAAGAPAGSDQIPAADLRHGGYDAKPGTREAMDDARGAHGSTGEAAEADTLARLREAKRRARR